MAKRDRRPSKVTIESLLERVKQVRLTNAGRVNMQEGVETLLAYIMDGPNAPRSIEECDTVTRVLAMMLYDLRMPEDAAGAVLH